MKGGGKMIRVIIERRCRPGKEAEMENLLVELRTRAMQQRGYISGETINSADDTSLWLVISTWVDADLWHVWETMPERRELMSKVETLLIAPEKVSIFNFARRGGTESAHKIGR